ncbi:hypothetical protein Nepgr_006607 [Nepenthes gracilis]|uniref:Uncharacterized protein n=1 Tax=Nepenthes gracilis TaxID=150966 RepID=A0AAD3XHH4_NEPGR|nr:hypothetical protein Nepgr_006607 [Nepenthes gracilis]
MRYWADLPCPGNVEGELSMFSDLSGRGSSAESFGLEPSAFANCDEAGGCSRQVVEEALNQILCCWVS